LRIQKKFEITVPKNQQRIRLDKYLTSLIENSSRTKIQKAIENGWVRVNNYEVKPNYMVHPHIRISVELPEYPEKPDIVPENIPMDIVYEDEYLLIVNKPANMVTHPAHKNYSGTLVNALLHYMSMRHFAFDDGEGNNRLSNLYGIERAGIVHRLDKDTSGLLVVAKNDEVHRKLAHLFSTHNIEREYWAVVWGHFKKKMGVIERALGRSRKDRKKIVVAREGKLAITQYEVLQEFDLLTLIKLRLMTGRTHQIRVHMHSTGHPVFGDPTYEGRKPHGINLTVEVMERINELLSLMPRQALHAKVLGFVHPITKEKLRFDSPLPADMQNLIEHL
jgi:23S rRNA pseudouridine1911/1915/1917 synthase